MIAIISVFRLLQNKLQCKDLALVPEIMKTTFFFLSALDIVSFILIPRPPLNFSNCKCQYMKKMIVHYFMECNKVCWSMETTHKELFPLQRKLNARTRKHIPVWKRTNVLFSLFLAEEPSSHVTHHNPFISIKMHFRY